LVAEEAYGDRRRRHTEYQGEDDRGHEERRRLGDLLPSDQRRDARGFSRAKICPAELNNRVITMSGHA